MGPRPAPRGGAAFGTVEYSQTVVSRTCAGIRPIRKGVDTLIVMPGYLFGILCRQINFQVRPPGVAPSRPSPIAPRRQRRVGDRSVRAWPTIGDDEQTFGENQQVRHAGGGYAAGISPPLAEPRRRRTRIGTIPTCIFSSPCLRASRRYSLSLTKFSATGGNRR